MDGHYTAKEIIRMGTNIIKDKDKTPEDLIEFYQDEIINSKVKYDKEYIFSMFFKNACLHGKKGMIKLLYNFYTKDLSVVGQIGLVKMFPYCKVTISRSHPSLEKWFNEEIMQPLKETRKLLIF